jgi:hypothetical protein
MTVSEKLVMDVETGSHNNLKILPYLFGGTELRGLGGRGGGTSAWIDNLLAHILTSDFLCIKHECNPYNIDIHSIPPKTFIWPLSESCSCKKCKDLS